MRNFWCKAFCFPVVILLGCLVSTVSYAGTTIFILTPTTRAPNQIIQGQTAVAIYKVTNNAPVTLSGNGVVNLPSTVKQVTGSGFCGATFNLSHGQSCNLKLEITGAVDGGPEVCYTPSSKVYCSQPTTNNQLNVKVVQNPTNLPISAPSSVDLVAGDITNITVTNDSSSTKANNINISFPSGVESEFSSVIRTGCESVNPGGTCTIHLVTKSTASSSKFPATATIQGSNTKATTTRLVLTSGEVTAANVVFTTPGQKSLVLTNNASQSASINQVQFTSGSLQNVSIGDIPSSCDSLGAGDSCSVPLTSTVNSYGNGVATVSYDLAGAAATTTANVSVANTTVSINAGQDVKLNPTEANQTITISNTGNFTWQNAAASFASSLTNTTINENTCTGTIATGNTCQLDITTNNATLGQSTTLSATGDNIATTQQSVTIDGGLSITPDTTAANQHLFYRAVKVENLTGDNAQVTNVTVNNLDNQVTWCQAGDNSCDFTSTCQLDTNITSGASCLLWFKSEVPSNGSLGAANGTITVAGTTSSGNTSTTVNAAYTLDLYVGGDFNTVDGGNIIAGNIAKWDGADWSAITVGVTNGVDNVVHSFTTYDGDLYAGGEFTAAGGTVASRVAEWNGDSWTALGDGVSGGGAPTVNALHVFDGSLYVGGSFLIAGAAVSNNVAAWDGTNWSVLGDDSLPGVSGGANPEVNAITAFDNQLYLGGAFTSATDPGGNPVILNNIVSWSGAAWDNILDGVDSTVNALSVLGGSLYVGGNFDNVNTIGLVNKVASWNGIDWSDLVGNSSGRGVNDNVFTLASIGTTLYVGGEFTVAGVGNVVANTKNIADWDGTDWGAVGTGVTSVNVSGVYAQSTVGSNLYIGGNFTEVGGQGNTLGIAHWNGTAWSALGGGIIAPGVVRALIVAPSLDITAI